MICPNCQKTIADNSNFCYYCGARQPAAPPIPKRLMRSATNTRIAGVCAGFAEYMDADPTLIRLLVALLAFFTGIIPGIVAYLVAWVIMPKAPLPVAASVQSPANQPAQSSG